MPRYNAASLGLVAQLVEQRIENPRVGGSIPPQATKEFKHLAQSSDWAFCFLDFIAPLLLPCGAMEPKKTRLGGGPVRLVV